MAGAFNPHRRRVMGVCFQRATPNDRFTVLMRIRLSGGEQQRVCIARALINQPKIILADEPTGNLDAANEEIVLDIFRRLHAQGHTLIVVTHDARVGRLADRLIALEHGRVARAESNGHDRRRQVVPEVAYA